MPLLSEELSLWEIGFRWSGLDPDLLWLRLPLLVKDQFRNLMDAILKGELLCSSITLEKREFEPDEKQFSVYFWLDDIYACIQGLHFKRKLLRWSVINRYDLMLWCERMNAPLPEFWFPPGWNLEYDLPEGDIPPGYFYVRQEWTAEELEAWRQEQRALKSKHAETPSLVKSVQAPEPFPESPPVSSPMLEAAEKMRPNQEIRAACQQIAKVIWKHEPDRLIASVVKDDLIQKYGGGSSYVDATVREWVKVVAPPHVRAKRGRPKSSKNGAEEQ